MQSDNQDMFRVLYREAFARRGLIVAAFMLIAFAAVVAGLFWPKSYTSSTTVLVENQSIIEPLMEGAAVSGDVVDQALNARETIYGRTLLMKVLEKTGRLDGNPTPAEVEGMLEGVRTSTTVTNVGQNLIKIEYKGGDPEQVYKTTSLMADLFIDEMSSSRSQESNAAYEFINAQVAKYEQQLSEAEQRLKVLRTRHDEARPGAEEQSTQRVADLRAEIDSIEQQLREAEIRERSLQAQLNDQVQHGIVSGEADRIRTRINGLQSELDTLRLTYHDTYPDIVILKEQIAELEKALAAEERQTAEARQEAAAAVSSGSATAELRANPVYQQLQTELYDTRTAKQTLRERLASTEAKLEQELTRADRIQEVAAEFQALMRDYEVNQAIYEDLLRRRETARVSMNLNSQPEGLTLRVVEPAYFSHSPSGPGLVTFAVGGLLLGAVVPLGLLFGLLSIDPRVRTGQVLSEELRLPVLGEVPHMNTPRESGAQRRGAIFAGTMVVLTVAAVIAVVVLRMQGVI